MPIDLLQHRWRATENVAPRLLLRRTRMIPAIVIAGNVVFAAGDPWLYPADLLVPLSAIKIAIVTLQVLGLQVLRGTPSRRTVIAVGLISIAGGVVGGTVSGGLTGDPFTTPLLCCAGALTTAAVVPWGGGPQAVAAGISAAGALYTIAQTLVIPTPGYPAVAIGTVAILSVYIAHELGRQRAAEARATVDLRRHQAELAHVLRVRTMGEMTAQLAHELTQPLGAIANFSAGARRRLEANGADPELIAVIEHVRTEALRAGDIIRRLRALIRKEKPRRTLVDVNALTREVADLLVSEARERHVRLELRLDPALPRVEGDGVQIEQVLINLMRNALEAMHDGAATAATLAVETRRHEATVEVAVRDSGPGVRVADAGRIFEPFHTTKAAGLGMGLAISRSIIEAHGGRLWLASQPGEGATFRFSVPIHPAAET